MDKRRRYDQGTILEKINNAISDSIYIFDLNEQNLVWLNKRGLELYGYSLEETMHPDDIPTLQEAIVKSRNLKDDEVLSVEYRFKVRQGNYHWHNDRITVFSRNEAGEVTAILGVATDINERKEFEDTKAKMISSAKMAALGEMSGGIAHEINNPLTVIQARAFQLSQMVELDKMDTAKVKQAAESISRTADKIARIIKSLRSFAREGTYDPFEVVPIKQIIEETLEFCRTRFYNHGIDIEVGEIDSELEVECRLIQIEQVLLNLLNNSFDAIQFLPTKWIRISVTESIDAIEISVSDAGEGVPPAIADQIMLPFFTTKEVGKGTGLGLSISAGIMRTHKGSLTLQKNAPNTTFVIRLPKWQGEETLNY